nr:unnamed protein product [Callosobruchus analis]
MNIKLPAISLPSFSGSYDTWLEFYDCFNALIHNNVSLSSIQKFYYLRSSLKGEAAQIMASLEASDSNYPVAWELLKERYENKKLIVNKHVTALFALEPLAKENYTALRKLHDDVQRNIRSLEALGLPVKEWDILLIYLITSKLDSSTQKQWETEQSNNNFPSMEDLSNFIKRRCQVLESLGIKSNESHKQQTNISQEKHEYKTRTQLSYASTQVSCTFCKKSHIIYSCDNFSKLSSANKLAEVKRRNLCINCLRNNHKTEDCVAILCRKCNHKHHTLLHDSFQSSDAQTRPVPNQSSQTNHNSPTNNTSSSNHTESNNQANHILLSTAYVKVFDTAGKEYDCRVLLDSGSQSNFISEDLCQQLKLTKTKTNLTIIGVNQNKTQINYQTVIEIHSKYNSFKTKLTCLIVPQITEKLPLVSFEAQPLNIPSNIKLADPAFNISENIDILIGSSVFWSLLTAGQLSLGKQKPTLQKTQLGWIIAGPLSFQQVSNVSVSNFSQIEISNLQNQVQKFWSLEEIKPHLNLTREEQEVESHFNETTRRDSSGRFIVSLPKHESISTLGESRNTAMKRFYNLERRLDNNPSVKQEYTNFIKEYITLNHMKEIEESNNITTPIYYIPHHAVTKDDSLTTKLRVVFDASCKTSSGLSLNEALKVGPNVQQDLLSILLRFRQYSLVITADIEKMYRQVLLANDDKALHRIFWRNSNSDQLKCSELQTVTYGTSPAAYLATRCLQQVAIDLKVTRPDISLLIERDFYVDDLLTSTDDIEELKTIYTELSLELSKYGFHLRKWLSNAPEIFSNTDHNQSEHHYLVCDGNTSTKTLGVSWSPRKDKLQFHTNLNSGNIKTTKRSILSATAQIYDPLGLLGPVTILAKILIQKLWQIQLSWDEQIPPELQAKWIDIKGQLPKLHDIEIPRHVTQTSTVSCQLHGFADASESAYGACIYIRSINQSGKIESHLLTAKSRVAPLKCLTLPRLELCAAVLLVHLYEKVINSITLKIDSEYFWTDSTIVLSWINTEPKNLKTFVSNRIAEIQSITKPHNWHHVNSSNNPADLISRGLYPNQIIDNQLWWHGPPFLLEDQSNWPNPIFTLANNIPEIRTTFTIITTPIDCDIFSLYSSLTTMQRVVAYLFRFGHNARHQNDKQVGHLSVSQLEFALSSLIKLAQRQCYLKDIQALQLSKSLHAKSKLLPLNPFLDKNGVLRVGGRLRHNSQLKYEQKHQIILPTNHTLTNLIARDMHIRLLHCGPLTLLSHLREKFWPIRGKGLVKRITHECIKCYRHRPKPEAYLMGSLPEVRTKISFPFENSGIDYAGPLMIRDRKGKGYKTNKCYIALFVCLSTKAIHLEVVTDLTADNFIASLRRFISRRGKPRCIYSDNGSNFVGAHRKLNEIRQFFQNQDVVSKVTYSLSNEGISWSFIPPKAPHFGGIWEAGVRSVKTHLRKVMGNALLTYEELATVLVQIEALLNSRPLSPLSTNPSDLEPLTPSHFLIGRSMAACPDSDVLDVPTNRLDRYQLQQSIIQHFWKRWQREYIPELQGRVKWKLNKASLAKPGSLVVLREDGQPPFKWPLGRIEQLYYGADNIPRVALVKCNGGIVKRPLSKLCILPID